MPDVLDDRLRLLAREMVANAPPPPSRPEIPELSRRNMSVARRLVAAAVALVLLVAAIATVVALDDNDGGNDPAVSVTPSTEPEWRPLPTIDGAYTLRSSFPFWTGDELVTIRTESSGRGVEGDVYRPADGSVRPIAPSGLEWRANAAVVWTGDEVIVAGGDNGPGIRNVAAAYDPATDTWRPLPNPPGDTSDPSDTAIGGPAVWTGQEMVVLRGNLAFDPARNTWREIAPGPLSPRRDVTIVAIPGGLMIWGGCAVESFGQCDDLLRGELDDGAVYDAATDEWTMVPDGPLAAAFHPTSVWTGEEVVVVVNRPFETEGALAAAYDPETRRWRTLPRPPSDAGQYAVSVWTGREMVTHSPSGVVTALDPERRTWITLPSGPVRDRQSIAWTGEDVVVTGGYPTGEPWALTIENRRAADRSDAQPDAESDEAGDAPAAWRRFDTTFEGRLPAGFGDRSAYPFWTGTEIVTIVAQTYSGLGGEVHDPDDGSVRKIATLGQNSRYSRAVAWTGSEVVVIGGSKDGPGEEHPAAAYDPVRDSWRVLPDPPGWRYGQEANQISPAVWTGRELVAWQSGLAFDPARDAWREIARSPLTPRHGAGLTAVPGGLFVWGGCDADVDQCDDFLVSELGDGAIYDDTRDTWTMLPPSPIEPGHHATATWTGSEVVVIVNQPVRDGVAAAAYDPTTRRWRELPPPPWRAGPNAVSVRTGTRLVVLAADGFVAALDPALETWADLPTVPVKIRTGPVGVVAWTGEDLLVTGGYPDYEPWALRVDE